MMIRLVMLSVLLLVATTSVHAHMYMIWPPSRKSLDDYFGVYDGGETGTKAATGGGDGIARCGVGAENTPGQVRSSNSDDPSYFYGNEARHGNEPRPWDGILYTGVPFEVKVVFGVNHGYTTTFGLRIYDSDGGFTDNALSGSVTSPTGGFVHTDPALECPVGSTDCSYPNFPTTLTFIPPGYECENCAFTAMMNSWNACSDVRVRAPSYDVVLSSTTARCSDCADLSTEGTYSSTVYAQMLTTEQVDRYIQSVSYTVDNVMIGPPSSSSKSPYSVALDTTVYANGVHTLVATYEIQNAVAAHDVTAITLTSLDEGVVTSPLSPKYTTTLMTETRSFTTENTFSCNDLTKSLCTGTQVLVRSKTCSRKGCSESECCEAPGVCSSVSCGSEQESRDEATVCLGPVCTSDECCEGTCTGMICPDGNVKTPTASSTACSLATCTNSECCVSKDVCGAINCGTEMRPRAATLKCDNGACTEVECCYAPGKCELFDNCPGGQAKNTMDCDSDQDSCTQDLCCSGECASHTCTGGSNSFNLGPATRLCPNRECVDDDCCGVRATCQGTQADGGEAQQGLKIHCESPKIPKYADTEDGIFCNTDKCTSDECCVEPQHDCVNNYVCKAGFNRKSAGYTVCPTAGCNAETCCDVSEVLPRPDDLPLGATRFVLQLDVCVPTEEEAANFGAPQIAAFDRATSTTGRFKFVGITEGSVLVAENSNPILPVGGETKGGDEASVVIEGCKRVVLTVDVLHSSNPPSVQQLIDALLSQLKDASSPLRGDDAINGVWTPTLPNDPDPSVKIEYIGGVTETIPKPPAPVVPDETKSPAKTDEEKEKEKEAAKQNADDADPDASTPVIMLVAGVGVLLIVALFAGVVYFYSVKGKYAKMESRFENEMRTKYDRRASKNSVVVEM